jgi:hypothetical protein
MKKYKHITIEQKNGETWENKPVYEIWNNKSGGILAKLFYYSSWKRYIFRQEIDDAIFDINCLKDIVDFLENEIK